MGPQCRPAEFIRWTVAGSGVFTESFWARRVCFSSPSAGALSAGRAPRPVLWPSKAPRGGGSRLVRECYNTGRYWPAGGSRNPPAVYGAVPGSLTLFDWGGLLAVLSDCGVRRVRVTPLLPRVCGESVGLPSDPS